MLRPFAFKDIILSDKGMGESPGWAIVLEVGGVGSSGDSRLIGSVTTL